MGYFRWIVVGGGFGGSCGCGWIGGSNIGRRSTRQIDAEGVEGGR